MQAEQWKVGELAAKTGLSVRTLHHYDEIGLLTPSHRSPAGYRLYGVADIARLQQIKSLRQLGFALNEIRSLLDHHAMSPLQIVELHLRGLEEQLALQQRLAGTLRALAWKLSTAQEMSAVEIMESIEVINMVDNIGKYYTPEQTAEIRQRGEQLGEARIRQAEAEWAELIARMRDAMEREADPASPEVQALAARWRTLIEEFTGGNPGIERSLQTMYQSEPGLREFTGIDERLMAYVGKAMSPR